MTTFQMLEQFCEIVQGGRHKLSGNDFVKDGYPAYGAGGMNGYLPTFEFDESAVILSSIGARCGKCFYVEGRWSSLANTQVIFPDKSECDSKFLWYQLNDEKRWPRAGTGQPFIKPSDVKRHKVFLPPIDEQRRIAAILDQAETLRTQRRTALSLLDSLTQSLFLDMFGDPVANPKGWPTPKFGEVGTLDRGISKHRPRNAPELLGGKHPLVQTGEVANCDGYIRSYTSTYSDLGLRQSKMWPAGTLCITIAANIAKTGILTFDACFPDSVVGFQADDPATVEYVRVWLSFLQKALEDSAPESAQKNINLAILRGLSIPLPPLPLQQTFATRIAAIEALKATHRRALAALDALFASLQQRAFTGAL